MKCSATFLSICATHLGIETQQYLKPIETQQVVWIRRLTHHFGKKVAMVGMFDPSPPNQPVGFPGETDPSFVRRFRHTEKYAKSDKLDQVWRSMPILPVKDAMLGEIDHSLICKNSPNIWMNGAPWRLLHHVTWGDPFVELGLDQLGRRVGRG